MTETTTQISNEFTVSKDDLKALKTCDSVCFDHSPAGNHTIRAIKRGKAPFYQDATYPIKVRSSVFIHSDGPKPNLDHAKCFEMFSSSKYNDEWQTIVGLVKVGDEIKLRWIGADNNGYVNRSTVTEMSEEKGNAGLGMKLYHDKLYLSVWRAGKQKYAFQVSDSVSPNNSARMIQI